MSARYTLALPPREGVTGFGCDAALLAFVRSLRDLGQFSECFPLPIKAALPSLDASMLLQSLV